MRLRKLFLPRLWRAPCVGSGFLAGFAAEKPAIDVHADWDKAQEMIRKQMSQPARKDLLS